MARDHARILTAVWRNDEFRALPVDAQHLYFTAVSQQALTYAGVLDWRAGRLAALAQGSTAKKVETAAAKLERHRFVVIDRDTEELLIRTYVKHDGVLNRENMGKACARAYLKVVSQRLRSTLLEELGRFYGERPDLSGWKGFAALAPAEFDRIVAVSSTIPLPIASSEA
jgi:hypothetical protein